MQAGLQQLFPINMNTESFTYPKHIIMANMFRTKTLDPDI